MMLPLDRFGPLWVTLESLWVDRPSSNWKDYCGATMAEHSWSRIRIEGRRTPHDTAHTYPRGNDVKMGDFRHHYKTTLVKWTAEDVWRVLEKDIEMREYTSFVSPDDDTLPMDKDSRPYQVLIFSIPSAGTEWCITLIAFLILPRTRQASCAAKQRLCSTKQASSRRKRVVSFLNL